ncbi:MAG TPA: DUF1501 domain-containing protein, partial [Planctomycetaceae bacterium]|nr:DUF1501 domain-containing protein [Planctomycetaceae bacterium]
MTALSSLPLFHSPLTRRGFLQAGVMGTAGLGLTLPQLLANTTASKPGQKVLADNIILLFLDGGPSHLDMWDMKPTAPDGIRGEFNPISTSLPGYQLSEHLPKLSQHMHRATVVRSMHHTVNNSHGA